MRFVSKDQYNLVRQQLADALEKHRVTSELFEAALSDYNLARAYAARWKALARNLRLDLQDFGRALRESNSREEAWKKAAGALSAGDCPPMCASAIGCTDMGCKIADARELIEAARKLEPTP